MNTLSRRTFLAASAAIALRAEGNSPQLVLFSKHLPRLDWDELGKTVKDLGFAGVDLTVRPKGHVLPERAAQDLERAVDAIRRHGLGVPMITTELVSASDATAGPILKAASKAGVAYFKPGYWKYAPGDNVLARVREVGAEIRRLGDLAAEHRVVMGLHNQSGAYVRRAVWDTWEMIRDLDPRWTGFYYDPGHAAIEGGTAGHDISLRLALPRLKMVALKDFIWKRETSGWKTEWCPMGEGAVDWKSTFRTLREARFQGPVSLHLEYTPKDELEAIRRDLAFTKSALV